MARIRIRLAEPSDGLPPVTGTAAGCTRGVAVAVPAVVAATEPDAVTVAVADEAGVGVSVVAGVGVSVVAGVGVSVTCARPTPLNPTNAIAPKIRTASPAIKNRPILLLLSFYKLLAAIVQNEATPKSSRVRCIHGPKHPARENLDLVRKRDIRTARPALDAVEPHAAELLAVGEAGLPPDRRRPSLDLRLNHRAVLLRV